MPSAKKTEKTTEKKAKEESKAPVKTVRTASAAAKKPTAVKNSSKLSAEVYDLTGKVVEKISLPSEIFAVKINKPLIAQAIRVFRANQRLGTASTKTRGEVQGSSRKIYRQKGTGRARHGTIRAPIFVHGGIVGGPKPRDYSLQLPKKMKKAALYSALSAKLTAGEIKFIHGWEKIEPKTQKFVTALASLGLNDKKKKILVVMPQGIDNLQRSARNVQGLSITAAQRLNTYDILNNRQILFMKESLDELKNHFLKNKKEEKAL